MSERDRLLLAVDVIAQAPRGLGFDPLTALLARKAVAPDKLLDVRHGANCRFAV